jgi:hypothetical protein
MIFFIVSFGGWFGRARLRIGAINACAGWFRLIRGKFLSGRIVRFFGDSLLLFFLGGE